VPHWTDSDKENGRLESRPFAARKEDRHRHRYKSINEAGRIIGQSERLGIAPGGWLLSPTLGHLGSSLGSIAGVRSFMRRSLLNGNAFMHRRSFDVWRRRYVN
jgi:hypothetical protein